MPEHNVDVARRPRLLDLFCCEGGAGAGYARAGFDVTGVDLDEERGSRYPFTFIHGDAFAVLNDLAFVRSFDVVHASPPCQGYTTMSNRYRGGGGKADEWDREIPRVRDALALAGVPYVIENVVGARRAMHAPILLRGGMFGLAVDRPRLFESSVPITAPGTGRRVLEPVGVYGARPDGRRLRTRADGTEQRAASSIDEGAAALGGLDWMSWDGLRECIPPAFTEHIGLDLMFYLSLDSSSTPSGR